MGDRAGELWIGRQIVAADFAQRKEACGEAGSLPARALIAAQRGSATGSARLAWSRPAA